MEKLNGFLITGLPRCINGITYHGFDTEAWPMKEKLSFWFNEPQMREFEESTDDYDIGDNNLGLINYLLAKTYVSFCIRQNCHFRILYIETLLSNLPLNDDLHCKFAKKSRFLGYDVGICAYDYYSSLLSDVIARPNLLDENIFKKLNSFGLIGSIEDLNFYVKKREEAKKKCDKFEFEEGVMNLFAIYNVPAIEN